MRYYALFLVLALASCDNKPKTLCDNFEMWAQSGPRSGQGEPEPTRIVQFLSSKGCYAVGQTDQSGFYQCVVIDWACSSDASCADSADLKFSDAVAIERGFSDEFKFFENVAVCIGVRKAVEPWVSTETNSTQSYSVLVNGLKYDLNFEPAEKTAKIKITYSEE